MSVAEDTELRDLVSQVLEKNGTLAKIRAELRASVFLALEDQPPENKSHFLNKALKNYLAKPESALGLCLVREFLEYLQLDNTLAVFNTETHHGEKYEYKGRSSLLKDLHLEKFKEEKSPLLSIIIQIAQDSLGPVSSAAGRIEEQQGGDFETNSTSSPKPILPSNINYTDTSSASLGNSHNCLNQTFTTGALVTSFDSLEASLDKHPTEADCQSSKLKSEAINIKQELKSGGSNGDINPTRGLCDTRQGLDAGDIKNSPTKEKFAHSTHTNPQTTLSNLPPLTELKTGKNHGGFQKSLLNALIGTDDHYDEDFSSESSGTGDRDSRGKSGRVQEKKDESAPDKSSSKDLNSPAASVSEDLEGDGNSATDEVNSAASADTLDSSLSTLETKVADHIEQC